MGSHGYDAVTLSRAWLLVLSTLILVASCGGGGGGGGFASGRPESTYIAQHSLSASYQLNRENVPIVSEVLRYETLQPVFIFDSLRDQFTQPVPEFNLPNGTSTVACELSGSVDVTIRAGGATIFQTFQNCRDASDRPVINGTVRFYLFNVDAAKNSYNAVVEFDQFQETLGEKGTRYHGVSYFSVRIEEPGIIYLNTETNRTVFDVDVQEEYESNLAYLTIYFRLPDVIPAVGEIEGYIDFQNSGTILMSSNPNIQASVITGLGSQPVTWKFFLNHYAIGFTDNGGEQVSVGVPVADMEETDVFSSSNTPPAYVGDDAVRKIYASESEKIELYLDEFFYEADLDLLNVDVTVACSPEGSQYEFDLSDPFKIVFNTDSFGNYALIVRVTSSDGEFAEGLIYFDYWQDEAAQNEGNLCQGPAIAPNPIDDPDVLGNLNLDALAALLEAINGEALAPAQY